MKSITQAQYPRLTFEWLVWPYTANDYVAPQGTLESRKEAKSCVSLGGKVGARAPHTSTDNKNKPTLSRAPRRQCRAYSTKKKSPLDRGSRLTVRGVGGRSPPGVVVWRTCRNSQHESHSLAEVIKDVSGCAIEGRFISIPPHEGVHLAEGGLLVGVCSRPVIGLTLFCPHPGFPHC